MHMWVLPCLLAGSLRQVHACFVTTNYMFCYIKLLVYLYIYVYIHISLIPPPPPFILLLDVLQHHLSFRFYGRFGLAP
jgi:hypothetical protein